MSDQARLPAGAIILKPDGGRRYALGSITAIFKADEAETAERYSVSEWWLEPNTSGPGAHFHEANDEIFYVIAGRPSVLVGEEWIDAATGSFIRIPAGVMHDFENRTNERAGLFNVYIPGGFERNMPAIVDWFRQNR